MLEPGSRAPDFELPDADGKTWALHDLRGRKVILYFYPKDDTPGCTAQACDFRDARADLAAAGYVVLGVSPQGAASHRAFADKHSLNFPLLIDDDHRVAEAYGVWGEKTSRGRTVVGIRRSTFVIDEDGVVEQSEYGVDAAGHVTRLRAAIGA